jgi:hypothetical protein
MSLRLPFVEAVKIDSQASDVFLLDAPRAYDYSSVHTLWNLSIWGLPWLLGLTVQVT